MRLVVAAGGAPQLSGSGPTVFAVTDDPERAAAMTGAPASVAACVPRRRGCASEPASIEAIEEPEE